MSVLVLVTMVTMTTANKQQMYKAQDKVNAVTETVVSKAGLWQSYEKRLQFGESITIITGQW